MCVGAEILDRFRKKMTSFERVEIQAFENIFYFKTSGVRNGRKNNGYDDENNDYIPKKNDHLAYRYQILKVLGRGRFGQVLLCLDHKTKEKVALKMLQHCIRTWQTDVEKEPEIILALDSTDLENNHIIRLHESFMFRGHFTMVLEFVGQDLRKQLRIAKHFPLSRVRLYTQAMLKALVKLKQESILHGDLKPENILVKNHKTGNIRITDFGVSAKVTRSFTGPCGTWPYMAPETLLLPFVTCAADMWSLGCVIVEILLGCRLFIGNYKDFLGRAIKILGLPPMSMILTDFNWTITMDKNGCPIVNGKVIVPSCLPLESLLDTYDKELLNFLRGCLEWDPALRLTPEQALEHDWVRGSEKAQGSAAVPSVDVPLGQAAAPQALNADPQALNADPQALNADPQALNADPQALNADPQALNADPQALNADPQALNADPQALNADPQALNADSQALNADPAPAESQLSDDNPQSHGIPESVTPVGCSVEEFVTVRSQQLAPTLSPSKKDHGNDEKEKEVTGISRRMSGRRRVRGFAGVRKIFRAFFSFIRNCCCCGCSCGVDE
ncbi:dual specificity tyrosine-phosphorylation-regulated kinase 4-like [Petromyzon marinus]|uniref:dual specificity tyrosine-phosphorylation-regulated kinase 4-like n=1 Tax=Petromyzon marinus TaxID=7757 RepID=UPI003F71920F